MALWQSVVDHLGSAMHGTSPQGNFSEYGMPIIKRSLQSVSVTVDQFCSRAERMQLFTVGEFMSKEEVFVFEPRYNWSKS